MSVLDVTPEIQIPLAEFAWAYSRSSGPGGQNVNKVNSRATLRWPLTSSPTIPDSVRQRLLVRQKQRITAEGDLLIHSDRYRDQPRNVADCLDRLKAMLLEVATVAKPRRPTRPTKGSQRRRLENKQQRSVTKSLRKAPRRED